MKDKIREYIKEELKKLNYKGDIASLSCVYPTIIEDVIGDFNKPLERNGYDCDYWASTDKYDVFGSMRLGTAEITLKIGEEKPQENIISCEENLDSKVEEDYTKAPDGSESWDTFYFSFGCGQMHEGYHQPIKAPNMRMACKRMYDKYGTKWAFNYTKEKWDKREDFFKSKPLELIYAEKEEQ